MIAILKKRMKMKKKILMMMKRKMVRVMKMMKMVMKMKIVTVMKTSKHPNAEHAELSVYNKVTMKRRKRMRMA